MKNIEHKDSPVKVLFKKPGDKSYKLYVGETTLDEIYSIRPGSPIMVKTRELPEDALENGGYTILSDKVYSVDSRHFHIVDPEAFLPHPREKAIVCDIDGCLNYVSYRGNTSHRDMVKLTTTGMSTQWTNFVLVRNAQKNKNIFDILKSYQKDGYTIIILTARGESQRITTEEFLTGHGGLEPGSFTLFMRGVTANDISAAEIKTITMQACIIPYFDVEMFIEDTQANISAIKEVYTDMPCILVQN